MLCIPCSGIPSFYSLALEGKELLEPIEPVFIPSFLPQVKMGRWVVFSHRPPCTGFAGAHLLSPSQGLYSFFSLSLSPLSISLLSLSFLSLASHFNVTNLMGGFLFFGPYAHLTGS